MKSSWGTSPRVCQGPRGVNAVPGASARVRMRFEEPHAAGKAPLRARDLGADVSTAADMVALVQTAMMIPLMLVTVPAGAIAELPHEGLLRRDHGRGTFVTDPRGNDAIAAICREATSSRVSA